MSLKLKKSKAYAVKATNYTSIEKSAAPEGRTVKGLFASYNYFDSDRDVLKVGCMDKSLKDHGVGASKKTYRIKHLLFHDWEKVLTTPDVLENSEVVIDGTKVQGLYFESEMPNDLMGNETLLKYHKGTYDQHSIGFQYIQGKYVKKGDADWNSELKQLLNPQDAEKAGEMYLWSEIKLFEGSTVAFGANDLTPALGVKSEDKPALLIKYLGKLESLKKQLTSGDISELDAYKCAIQVCYLQQLTEDLFSEKTDIKDTLEKSRQNGTVKRRFGRIVA